MMYEMVVSAFDNILINDEEAISYDKMLEIDRIRNKKIKFTIATSRCLGDILYYNKDFFFIDYVIASNGALVYDVGKEKIIFKKCVPVTSIRKIYNKFNYLDIYGSRMNRKFKITNLDDIRDIYKLEIVCGSLDNAKKVKKELDLLKLKINCSYQYLSGMYYIDIVNEKIDKFFGLEKICQKIDIKINKVVAFGNYYNDISLVKNVGMGIASKGSIKEIKDVAKKEDNILNFIKNNL